MIKHLILLGFIVCSAGCASDCDKLHKTLFDARTAIAGIPEGKADNLVESYRRTLDEAERVYADKCK